MIKAIKYFIDGVTGIVKGLTVTAKNAFRKPVTIQYPLVKPEMPERYRGLVDLYPDKCIACSQCVKICPTAALDLKTVVNPETKKKVAADFIYNAELCCFCGLCEEVCPTDAMFMNKRYEASYYDHKDMTAIDLLNNKKYDQLGSAGPVENKP